MNKPGIPILLILAFFGTNSTCDRVINPFEDENGTYSVYGALNVEEDSHRIRVRNVTIPFLSDSLKGYEDIAVFFNYPDGQTVQLEDTVINFNGNYTYNYLLDGTLEPDSEYSLRLEFDDQEATSIISTPGISNGDSTPDQSNGCAQTIRIFINNIKQPEFTLVDVGVEHDGKRKWASVGAVDEFDHIEGTDRMEVELTVTNLLVDIFPPPPEATIGIPPRFWRPTVECDELDLNTMYFRYIHFGKEWEIFRDTDFLDDVFIDSGDIENGIGFIGAIRTGEFSFNFVLN